MIQILIVDDHPMVRAGLAAILGDAPDMAVIGQATNGIEAMEMAGRLIPDVALVDIHMPDMNGIELIGRFRERYPGIRTMMVSSAGDADLVQRALEQGASGYVLKEIEASTLYEAVRSVAQGQRYLDSHAARVLAQAAQNPQQQDYGLTRREYEILALIARGANNRDISRELFISYYTVKSHVSSIMTKLNVSNRTEATRKALDERLIRLD